MTDTDFTFDPDSGFGHERIHQLMPHRYPFILVDKVVGYRTEPDKRIRGIKNVTINEPFFPGHFPGHPVMPGVLIVEAMAQTAGILTQLVETGFGNGEHQFYLAKVDKAKFMQLVVPGDQLVMDILQTRTLRGMGMYKAEARCNGKLVASAEMMCAARSR